MDAFGDNFDQNDIDPAAEFLAREQDQLAGLEDELKPASTTIPTASQGIYFICILYSTFKGALQRIVFILFYLFILNNWTIFLLF